MAKPSWYYARQAEQAQARENFYRTYTPPETSTIESRGASTEVYYRSLILMDGTDHLIFRTSVDSATLNLVSAAEAGLMTSLASGDTAQRMKGSGLKPTRIQWYRGAATASRRRTAWNTSVARYYDTTGGRSHFSIPFSRATGVFNADDLTDQFQTLFGPGGTKRTLLGAVNGRAAIRWESATVSAMS